MNDRELLKKVEAEETLEERVRRVMREAEKAVPPVDLPNDFRLGRNNPMGSYRR